jgi:hypothetical protein
MDLLKTRWVNALESENTLKEKLEQSISVGKQEAQKQQII